MPLRPAFPIAAALACCLLASGCTSSEPDAYTEAKRLQAEIRRAIITTKSLGRFGVFALFQEEMAKVPCRTPLSETNRDCEVHVVGKGEVRMRIADARLQATGRVNDRALVRVEYPADCENQRFDFKTFDQALPRARAAAPAGMTLWENKLVKVTHWRLAAPEGDACGVVVEAAPALLDELRGAPAS